MARKNEKSDLWVCCEVMEVSQSLKGKTFSITGHLGVPRASVVKIIENAGGKFEERPRWGVDFLISNKDWNANSTVQAGKSSKLLEAEKYRIKVITEDEFCNMVIAGGESETSGTSLP